MRFFYLLRFGYNCYTSERNIESYYKRFGKKYEDNLA